ncbi:MAG: hypothetical protein V7K90_31475 [Nostoc sp.]|uniref:hypothetical protein n=1 Tax=Nostoc sp. TaxID=1180 RepID=UPI002FF5CAB7
MLIKNANAIAEVANAIVLLPTNYDLIASRVASYQGMNLEFEWHNQKASLNLNKHRISFEAAKTVFNDFLAYSVSRLCEVHP